MGQLVERLHTNLGRLPAASLYWVAYSGGMDSHVLLHAMAQLAHQGRCAPVQAIHINHQLSMHADEWAQHCLECCAKLGVPCDVEVVDARARRGESPEAAARHARYAALARNLNAGQGVLTAQHLEDQAETLLLQLIRGAGIRGLSAMSHVRALGGGWLGRPLLSEARSSLRAYAEAHQLKWVDDPSNFDTGLERNFVRHDVLPLLERRRPGVCRALGRSSQHFAEAAELLDDLARSDLASARGMHPGTLSIAALLGLTPARQRNALRGWLSEQGVRSPDRDRLVRIQEEVISARADATPLVGWDGVHVRRHRDELYLLRALHDTSDLEIYVWQEPNRPLQLDRHGIQLRLAAAPPGEIGIDPDWLSGQVITVRFRHGGERCQVRQGGPRRTLKKLFQEWGVPSWERRTIPLIYASDELIEIPGYCICAGSAPVLGVGGVRVELLALDTAPGR